MQEHRLSISKTFWYLPQQHNQNYVQTEILADLLHHLKPSLTTPAAVTALDYGTASQSLWDCTLALKNVNVIVVYVYNLVLICTLFLCKAKPKCCIGRGHNKINRWLLTSQGHTVIIMPLTYCFDLGWEITYYQHLQGSFTCHWGSNGMGPPH